MLAEQEIYAHREFGLHLASGMRVVADVTEGQRTAKEDLLSPVKNAAAKEVER